MKKDNLSVGNLVDRLASPTPSFWKKIQKLAVVVGAIAASVVSAGAALPAVAVTVATYVGLGAGTVLTVAQLTKEDEPQTAADDNAQRAK